MTRTSQLPLDAALRDAGLPAGPAWFDGAAWVEAEDTLTVLDPGTGRPLAEVADVGVEAALAAAALVADPSWSEPVRKRSRTVAAGGGERPGDASTVGAATRGGKASAANTARHSPIAPAERAAACRAIADALRHRREPIAVLLALETGKPLAEARDEVDYARSYFEWYAAAATCERGGLARSPDGRSLLMTQRVPVGPALLITAWNLPLALAARKVAAAIAAGCPWLLKPGEQAPLAAMALTAAAAEAGAPGAILPTSEPGPVVEALVGSGLLCKLSFTGSTPVGKRLGQLAAAHDLRCSLELGGDAPAVVLEDADPIRAANAIVAAKRRNAGQTCIAPNRVIVHARHARALADRLQRELYRLRMGHALDPASELGPVIDERAQQRLESWIGKAVSGGADVGERPVAPSEGSFVAPAVVRDVDPDLLGTELFGPVLPMITIEDDADALPLARSGNGGLAAYVFCDDPVRGVGLGEELGVGMVAVNRGRLSEASAPFGGLGASGVGREGGLEGLEEYQSLVYSVVDAPSAK